MTDTEPLSVPDLSKVPSLKPEDLGIKVTETVGFTASPTTIRELIDAISLPKDTERVFPKFILNFTDNSATKTPEEPTDSKIWWGNRTTGANLISCGFADYSYFDNAWGNASIALSASKLMEPLNYLRVYKEVTFWADPKTKLWGLQAGDVDKFSNFLDSPTEIKSSYVKFPFNLKDYIPQFKSEESSLIYGSNIDASELRTLFERGKGFKVTQFPLKLKKDGISVSINDMFNPTDKGANEKKIISKPSSYNGPETDIEFILGPVFEAPSKNLKGEITLRFPKTPDSPVYLSKRDKSTSGGILYIGTLIGTKIKGGK